jgi:hypothetical protein
MARPKDVDRENTGRQRHRRQTASGLSVAAFCERECISAAAFYAWKKRLAAPSLPALPESPVFVPVDLDLSPRRIDMVFSHGVEIELPHEVRVRLDAVPEPEWLARVVAALAPVVFSQKWYHFYGRAGTG